MKRSIFNDPHIFALKPLFFEKNKIEWNQTDSHAIGSFPRFKSFSIKWNRREQANDGEFFSILIIP